MIKRVDIIVEAEQLSGTTTFRFTENDGGINVYANTELATSDCLDIKTSHSCTALIRYDNAKDFAGIEYSDFSPTAEFYLRIPAVFFHERNTEEEENFELYSENIVRLRNEIKLKRLLEVGYMPDYMHRKLLLVLAHDTIEIDSRPTSRWKQWDGPLPTPTASSARLEM